MFKAYYINKRGVFGNTTMRAVFTCDHCGQEFDGVPTRPEYHNAGRDYCSDACHLAEAETANKELQAA